MVERGCTKCCEHLLVLRCTQIPSAWSPVRLNFVLWLLIFVAPNMELPLCLLSGTSTFDVTYRFLANLCNTVVINRIQEIKIYKIILVYMLLFGRFGQLIRNTWKVLKCGAGEGWKRSVGPIM